MEMDEKYASIILEWVFEFGIRSDQIVLNRRTKTSADYISLVASMNNTQN